MTERTAESAMTVDEDGIRVEKSFTDDEFPVPTITYELSSARDEPARVRIVDTIPESFPMDRIGFHPEYESDNWTAYKDHRVEFERVLEPDESMRTIFGIRSDDPDIDGFLGTPVIEHVPVGEEIEDVLGTGETDAVREVLAGDRATLPGMHDDDESDPTTGSPVSEADPVPEEGPPAEDAPLHDNDGVASGTTEPDSRESEVNSEETETTAETVGDEPETTGPDVSVEPRETGVETTAAVTRRGDPADGSEGAEIAAEAPETAETNDQASVEGATDSAEDAASGETGSVAAELAAEIRSGDVDEDDLELIRSELDDGVPRSVDVRISRLQSTVADIEAYSDALAEFIDEQGTGREVLEDLRSRINEIESEVTDLDERAERASTERESLADDVGGVRSDVAGLRDDVEHVEESVDAVADSVESVEGSVVDVNEEIGTVTDRVSGLDETVDDLDDDVETLYEEVDDTAAALSGTDDRVTDAESRLDRLDGEFDDAREELAAVDDRLSTIEESLGDDVDDIEAELTEINDHLEELEAFRKRLNEAFGP